MRSHLRNTVMVAYVPLAELSDSQSKRGTRQTGGHHCFAEHSRLHRRSCRRLSRVQGEHHLPPSKRTHSKEDSLGCNSLAECLPSRHKVLGSRASTGWGRVFFVLFWVLL